MLMAKPRGDAVGLAAVLLAGLTVADFLVGTVVDLLAMLTAFPEEMQRTKITIAACALFILI